MENNFFSKINMIKLLFRKYVLGCLQKKYKKLEDELSISDDAIPYFSLKGNVYRGKITNIYNSKDFNICFKFGGKLTKFSCRLFGIDKVDDGNDNFNLSSFLPDNNIVFIVANNFDSNGKLLVTLYRNEYLRSIGDMSINELILIKNNIDGIIDNIDPFFEIELE